MQNKQKNQHSNQGLDKDSQNQSSKHDLGNNDQNQTGHAQGKSESQISKAPKAHDRIVMTWDAPEYIQHQKTTRWYLCAAVLIFAAIIWGIASDNLTMVLAVIVLTCVYQYTQTNHPPKIIKVEISELGIKVGKMFYAFSNIKAFWIIYNHGLRTLNLHTTNQFLPEIAIQLADHDPVDVRQYLVGQIPEWEGKTEKLGDMILRLLKL